jgi:coenzyme Q-binding protein COQ10
MFDLVMDIESYHYFLPWCIGSKIIQKIDEAKLIADLTVKFNVFTQKYRSTVIALKEKNNYIIDIESTHNVFDYLRSRWVFSPENNGSSIIFELDFKFRVPFFEKLTISLFEKISAEIIARFETRAKTIYKTPKILAK